MVGDGYWFDGRIGLGFGGGFIFVIFGFLVVGVVGVLFVGIILW